jgi:hypothetical protein
LSLLKREEWYDVGRDTNWTPRYVTEDDLFPEPLSGGLGLTSAQWERWDEPYQMTFREYLETQREKDSGAYSVKAALSRGQFFDEFVLEFIVAQFMRAVEDLGLDRPWYWGRQYCFCSKECRWIFQVEPERYQGHLGFIDRALRGMVPPGLEGALQYLGVAPGERGRDAEDLRWIDLYRGWSPQTGGAPP